MANFNNLKPITVSHDSTTEYEMNQISIDGKTPVLSVTSATNANHQYMNAMLKKSSKMAQQIRAGRIDLAVLEKNRKIDRELYSKFVVKDWRNVSDVNGRLDFSTANCEDFIGALPDWLFDQLRTFCSEPTNFVESLDVENVSKN